VFFSQIEMKMKKRYPKGISRWLWIGLGMVFVQILIGGITRLTDSGLSITEWEIIEGVLPPLTEEAWEESFELYKKEAKTQYERLHADMDLSEFKWIYFWEWFHRLWARVMGLVFIIPFLIFWAKSWIDKSLMWRLLLILFFAGSAGTMGWIMVASGLNEDNRTWVSAYKLMSHLIIAALTLASIYWTILFVETPEYRIKKSSKYSQWNLALLVVLIIQILWGGLMAGMRAGLLHPHWPVFVQDDSFWAALSVNSGLSAADWIDYEPSAYVKAVVQLGHRMFAYFVAGLGVWLALRQMNYFRQSSVSATAKWLIGIVIVQFTLGVITVMGSIGSIPVFWGVVHQFVAFILLLVVLRMCYLVRS